MKLLPPVLLLMFACVAASLTAAPAAPALQPLAHSALLTLEGASTVQGLTLRVRPTAAAAPLAISEFSVLLDGKSVTATPRSDGTWLIARSPADAPGARLDVTVTHDGIRELLSAKWPAAESGVAAAPATLTSASGVHKQIVWWVLNIAIVLIAALVISRRAS